MNIELFKSIPANSITGLPENIRLIYLENTLSLPEKVQDMLFSDSTGAYIQGLAKSNQISSENAFKIGLAILEIAIQERDISELSTKLSKELEISQDSALKMASEIDQDLFAPIQSDLDAFWAQQSSPAPAATVSAQPTRQTDSLPKQESKKNMRTTIVPTPPPSSTVFRGAKNILNLKEIAARPEQKDLPPKPVQQKLAPGSRTVDLKSGQARSASVRPTPPPLPQAQAPRVQSNTPPAKPTPPVPPARTFPLPPSIRK